MKRYFSFTLVTVPTAAENEIQFISRAKDDRINKWEKKESESQYTFMPLRCCQCERANARSRFILSINNRKFQGRRQSARICARRFQRWRCTDAMRSNSKCESFSPLNLELNEIIFCSSVLSPASTVFIITCDSDASRWPLRREQRRKFWNFYDTVLPTQTIRSN